MPLDNKCRIGPLAGIYHTRVRWSSSLILNRDSSLKIYVSSPRHTQVAEVGKNPVDTAYDVGYMVSVLADVGSSIQLRSVVSYMVSLDGTGCLEGAYMTLRRYTLPSVIPLYITYIATTISSPTMAADTIYSIPASLRPIYAAPIYIRQLLVLPPVTSYRHPKSQYRLSKSSDSFG
ncbi:hypothetical protein TNCV_812571 [Trichonephila clavipes]|nr:hypothetical protein TNCV_812571 [Trichonephila clavipes]